MSNFDVVVRNLWKPFRCSVAVVVVEHVRMRVRVWYESYFFFIFWCKYISGLVLFALSFFHSFFSFTRSLFISIYFTLFLIRIYVSYGLKHAHKLSNKRPKDASFIRIDDKLLLSTKMNGTDSTSAYKSSLFILSHCCT